MSRVALEAYRVLFGAADEAILIADWDTSLFIEANEMAVELTGYSHDELLTLNGRHLDDSPERYGEVHDELLATGQVHAKGIWVRRKDGSRFLADLLVRRFAVAERQCHVCVLRPCGEAGIELIQSARMNMLESQSMHRNLVRFTDDAVFVCEEQGGAIVQANRAMCELFGYREAELLALTRHALHPPDEPSLAQLQVDLDRGGAGSISSVAMRKKSGSLFRAQLRLNVFEAANRRLVGGIVRDVTEQLERERRLRETTERLATSEAVYRGVVACTDDAILILDYESGMVVEANPAACTLFGYRGDEWNALTHREVHPAGSSATLAAIAEQLQSAGASRMPSAPMLRKDGSTFPADLHQNVFVASGRKLVVAIVRDMTTRVLEEQELQRAQVQLLQAQKLAAVGEVAAGVAHEINNPAGYVSMNLEGIEREVDRLSALHAALLAAAEGDEKLSRLLRDQPMDLSALRAMLADNREGIERIRSVTRDLLVFSRVEHGEVADVDLNRVVRSTVNLLNSELRHRARIVLDLAADLPPIAAEQGKLAQVVTNLLLNAAQAIVEGDAESNEIRATTRRDGKWLSLRVKDTGVGMSEEVKGRMFEPFFTTKPRGQGTGLGLSLCVDIVRKHRGELVVESAPACGTCVEMRLPADNGMTRRAPSISQAPLSRRSRRILVIDDDAGMVRAYRRLLAAHDAVIVGSGAQALAALERDSRFDVILCDLMMPDMDGPQVYEAIAARAPHLLPRMVFCTGGAFTPRARAFLARVTLPVLDKPLDLQKLDQLLAREDTDVTADLV